MVWVVVFSKVPYSAMAVYPFVLVKKKEMAADPVLMNHERIHHRQQVELLIVPFYLLYLVNYLYNLLRYRHHYTAYRQIVFEREAYANETNTAYLQQRPYGAFLKYLTQKGKHG